MLRSQGSSWISENLLYGQYAISDTTWKTEQQNPKYVKKYRTGMEHSVSSQLWDQQAKFYSYWENPWKAETEAAPATQTELTVLNGSSLGKK